MKSLQMSPWAVVATLVLAVAMPVLPVGRPLSDPSRSDGSTQVYASRQTALSDQNPCFLSGELLFSVFHRGYNEGDAALVEVPTGGGTPRTVVFHRGHAAVNLPGACYSASAGRVAYASDLLQTDNIWTAVPGALDDREHRVTCLSSGPLHAQEPSWSPDGKWIVYEANGRDPEHPGRYSIYEISAQNDCRHPSEPILLVDAAAGRGSDNHEPNWSPDGRRIVFQRETDFRHGYVNLWTVRPDGSGLTRITNDPNSDTDPSWSPDGKWIVYSTDFEAPTGIANLFIVRPRAGGARRRLTGQCFYDGAPSWSPNGEWVSFETALVTGTNDPSRTAIWRIPASARPGPPSC